MRRSAGGFTLLELLIASIVGLLVAFGIMMVEGGRSQMTEEVIARTGFRSEQGMVALATVRMGESIATSDRFNIGGTTFQFRIPAGCMGAAPPPATCYDVAANYRWDQYRLVANELRLYSTPPGCGTFRVLARQVSALTFTYQDQAPAPPGGDGAVQDNNLLEYSVTWNNGLAGPRNRTHTYRGRVMGRAVPYSDVNTTGTQSGSGLALPGVSPPPGAC